MAENLKARLLLTKEILGESPTLNATWKDLERIYGHLIEIVDQDKKIGFIKEEK